MVRRINRKIKRGTLGHRKDPVVIEYENQYHIGAGLVFQILKIYGDSQYSHNLCKFISKKKTTTKISGIKFIDIIKDFKND